MARTGKSGTAGFCIWTMALLLLSAVWFTKHGVSDGIPGAVSLWVTGVGSALVLAALRDGTKDGAQCAVLYLAYLVRVVCMLADIYGREYITLLHSGGDSEGFYRGAEGLYYGRQNTWFLTKYPYVINGIFKIAGDNRVCAQYVNIIFWVLGCFVLVRLCKYFAVKEHARLLVYLLWGFLPTGILLTSILVRESMEMFFGLWSFERFIYWMDYGKKRYCVEAFLCVLPAIILHSASVALWAAYVVVVMFWDVKRQRYRWQVKSAAVLAGALSGVVAVFLTPVRYCLFEYFGSDFNLYAITHRPFVAGGSDYLAGMDCQSWVQFVPYTVIRMFYFLFSPLPAEVRGFSDVAMFLADGFPLLLAILYMCRGMWKKREERGYIWASLLGVIMFAGIFAWGVGNAGTALRHRYLAWSIVIAGLCICCSKNVWERDLKKSSVEFV